MDEWLEELTTQYGRMFVVLLWVACDPRLPNDGANMVEACLSMTPVLWGGPQPPFAALFDQLDREAQS
jgi:hypothetical protein